MTMNIKFSLKVFEQINTVVEVKVCVRKTDCDCKKRQWAS